MTEATTPERKRCYKCGEVKMLTEFYTRSDSPDGYRNDCRGCCAQRVEDPEKVRARRRKMRACTACGQQFRGATRRCRACSSTERECITCGETFGGVSRECRRCHRKVRPCAECGREFRGTNLLCGACVNTERQCTTCERTFKGHRNQCSACRTSDRDCTACGKTFRGSMRFCWTCQGRDRECTECGRQFKGTKTRCGSCQSVPRDCVTCGRTFNGHQAQCMNCQSRERICSGCGCQYRGTARRCATCAWLDLPLEEREAKARRWHGTRRARQLQAEIYGPVAQEVYAAILAIGICSYCGKSAKHVDHIRPLARGGVEHEDNLTGACKSCNSSKNAKLLTEWDAARVAHAVAFCPKVAAEYARQVAEEVQSVAWAR